MNEETKRCPKCELELPHARFSSRGNGRLNSYCKACQSVAARNHYVANLADYNTRRLQSQRRYYRRNREYIRSYLQNHPCVDCGEVDIIVLEFDHVDASKKTANISDMVRQAFSLERLKREIDFCVVRCVNCHRKRTYAQFSWSFN